MQIHQLTVKDPSSFQLPGLPFQADLILILGAHAHLQAPFIQEIRLKNSQAIMAGCTTAGEIAGGRVNDDSLVLNFLKFERSKVIYQDRLIASDQESLSVGQELARSLPTDNLKHCLVLSDGLNINGTQLVKGLRESLPKKVSLTGGLAADGPHFEKTFLLDNEAKVVSNKVLAIGFYGDIQVNYGSMGGWDSFGIERLVTRSTNNVVHELDSTPALKLYKSFLGPAAEELPSSGLLFPLSMRSEIKKTPLVRTILGVNEAEQSLTFAGDIPEGSYVRLMKANVDRLINGAEEAADLAQQENVEFALCISCVGRKLVLKQMVEEEVEAVQEVFGKDCTITGFYSYGEIAPFKEGAECELHNQTMTITSFSESGN